MKPWISPFLQLGNARIELVKPTSGDSGVAKYLAKRGPGLHHLCLEVADLDATLGQLRARGIELTMSSHARIKSGVMPLCIPKALAESCWSSINAAAEASVVSLPPLPSS